MKKIICLGDSNTFGFNPVTGSRYDSNTRWTALLSSLLGDEFEVAEEGCNNRTGFCTNPDGVLQSGQKYISQCVLKHKNFDVFIIALGTNDLQRFFKIDESTVRNGLKSLVSRVREVNPDVRIVIIPPVKLSEDVLYGSFSYQFDRTSIKASSWIQKIYEDFAMRENCELFDFNKYVSPSKIDGLHFTPESHKIIAEEIARHICRKSVSDGCEVESL